MPRALPDKQKISRFALRLVENAARSASLAARLRTPHTDLDFPLDAGSVGWFGFAEREEAEARYLAGDFEGALEWEMLGAFGLAVGLIERASDALPLRGEEPLAEYFRSLANIVRARAEAGEDEEAMRAAWALFDALAAYQEALSEIPERPDLGSACRLAFLAQKVGQADYVALLVLSGAMHAAAGYGEAQRARSDGASKTNQKKAARKAAALALAQKIVSSRPTITSSNLGRLIREQLNSDYEEGTFIGWVRQWRRAGVLPKPSSANEV